jgi:hypothetical protein
MGGGECIDPRLLDQLEVWAYSIQLWGAASTSNIHILERFQSKALRLITNAPRYVPNAIIRRDLQVPSVTKEIRRLSFQYYAGVCTHPNLLATQLSKPSAFRRLKTLAIRSAPQIHL